MLAIRILRRPAVRIGLALVAATVAVAGVTVTGLGRGYPAEQVRLLSGAAWLPSPAAGQVTLLNGPSAEVAAQLQVAPAGNLLDVVQQGSTAYAIDQTAGTIRRIDGATFELTQPESPIPDARGGLTAFAGPETLYALDTQRGILTATDPHTLTARGQPLSLAAQLETGSATIDDAGRLWAVDNANGDLISIAGDRRTTHRNTAKPGPSELTLAGGHPVIIDRGDRKAIVVDPDTGEISNTIGLDLRPGDSIAVSGSSHAQRLYLVASRGLLAICDLDATACDGAVPLDASGSELGPAVEAGNRLFIPDYTTGKVWIIDLAGRDVVAKAEVLTPPARFQLLTRDGIVFFNDPASERSGVIELNGGVRKIAKYDPKDPNKGLSAPSTYTTQTGEPAPDQPPGTQQPPQNQPPPDQPPPNRPPTAEPPPGLPPTAQPPTAQPPTTTPPPNQPPPNQPPPAQPTLQITLSKVNPRVNENITLQVGNTTGPAPSNATWDFGDGGSAAGVITSHQWAQARTYQVSVQATMPGGQQATKSLSVQVSLMPAPVHVSPANGSLFTNYPRNTTLKWNPVPGAAQYHVEVECLHCQQVGQWSLWRESTSAATSFNFTWVGDNDGRWHVTAIAADGTPGATSAWWQLSYDTSLSPPVQVSPANGAVFNNFPRTTTLKWNAAAGAQQYRIEIQCLGCGGAGVWSPWRTATIVATSYTFDYVGAQPGRWRVTAIGSGGVESAPSGWWQFEYTV